MTGTKFDSETSMPSPDSRSDIQIPAKDGLLLGAWLYKSRLASANSPKPALVLAHGLGGIKEMRLDAFAERFHQEGYTVVVFDYRYFGSSQGEPRQLLDVQKQNEDWHSAISYTRGLPEVDADKVGLWGTSFAGGHVIRVAAEDPKIAATIAQCPFTSGFASSLTISPSTVPFAAARAIRDLLFGGSKEDGGITRIALAGGPNEVALMNSPDSATSVQRLVEATGQTVESYPNYVAARIAFWILFVYPGRYAAKVQNPIFFAICGKDSVAPPKLTLEYAKNAPKGTIKYYEDMGHFTIYFDEHFERAVGDYLTFLRANLPIGGSDAKL